MEERCIVWDPVPREANRYMLLNVAFVEQMALLMSGSPLSILVVAPLEDRAPPSTRPAPEAVHTWRLTFERVAAFRSLPIERWDGSRPYADAQARRLEVAAWEIVGSRWLDEAIPRWWKHSYRHFVLASTDVVHEVAAGTWRSCQIEDWQSISARLRERWEHEVALTPAAQGAKRASSVARDRESGD